MSESAELELARHFHFLRVDCRVPVLSRPQRQLAGLVDRDRSAIPRHPAVDAHGDPAHWTEVQ
jgi:hypothetical protein